MGFRAKKEGLHRVLLYCQGVTFIGFLTYLMHLRYNKDTMDQQPGIG